MRVMLKNHIQSARDSLRANQMRTFLTITGVTIGVASIVTILSLATGATDIIVKQVNRAGGNLAVIRPGVSESKSLEDAANSFTQPTVSTNSLTQSDLSELSKLPSVAEIAPLLTTQATIKSETSKESSTIAATTADLFSISNIKYGSGTFEEDSQDLVTIGAQLSVELFGTEESLGKLVTVKGESFRVSGILERQANPVNFNGLDFDKAMIVNQKIMSSLDNHAQIRQINLKTESITELDRTVIAINKTLLAGHDNEHDFHILTGSDIAAPTGQLFIIIAGVTATIAGIALFIGGIGIMNIMLVNVSERTHEIGIRKALGATHGDIAWQFLIESIIMSLIGGVIGLLLGMFAAFCISLFLTFNPVVTWQIGAITISVSIVIGSLFGLYPAIRASKKDPIDSLILGG